MRKFSILFIPFIFLFHLPFNAQSAWNWANRAGGGGLDQGLAISTSPSGYSCVTGFFHNIGNFDTCQITSYGGEDIFIARYNSSGHCMWARNAGNPNNYPDEGWGVAQDSIGNCYVTGKYFGFSHFGSTLLNGSSAAGAFIAKYNTSGNLQWVKNSNPSPTAVESRAISTDAAGNSYIAGNVYGNNQYFGPFNVHSPCGFVAKYDAAGTELAAYQFGSHGGMYIRSVAADPYGNFYITGEIEAADTIGTIPVAPTGSNDYYVLESDANGNVIWMDHGIASASNIWYIGNSIALSKDGIVYVAATGADGDETIGGSYLVHALGGGDHTAFVVAYTYAGAFLWAQQSIGVDSLSHIEATSVSCDRNGNAAVAGFYYNSFTLGSATVNMSSPSGTNAFVIGLDPSGNSVFSTNTSGGYPGAFAFGVSTDGAGDVYTTGQDQLTSFFGTFVISPSGPCDIFVAKINNTTLGVADNNGAIHANIYGDGTSLHVDIPEFRKPMQIRIYDVQGRIVTTGKIESSSTAFDLNGLSSGIYLWQLDDTTGNVQSGRIMKY